MILIVCSILILLAIIFAYILGKKSGIVKEITKTVQLPPLAIEETNLYQDETEEQFMLRVNNFLTNHFNQLNIEYSVSGDDFFLEHKAEDGSPIRFIIFPFFNPYKGISFRTRISLMMITDDKLDKVVELINRLNATMHSSNLYLDYLTRHVELTTIYYMGTETLKLEYLQHHIFLSCQAPSLRSLLNRVLLGNEEPVLVVLDI